MCVCLCKVFSRYLIYRNWATSQDEDEDGLELDKLKLVVEPIRSADSMRGASIVLVMMNLLCTLVGR